MFGLLSFCQGRRKSYRIAITRSFGPFFLPPSPLLSRLRLDPQLLTVVVSLRHRLCRPSCQYATTELPRSLCGLINSNPGQVDIVLLPPNLRITDRMMSTYSWTLSRMSCKMPPAVLPPRRNSTPFLKYHGRQELHSIIVRPAVHPSLSCTNKECLNTRSARVLFRAATHIFLNGRPDTAGRKSQPAWR